MRDFIVYMKFKIIKGLLVISSSFLFYHQLYAGSPFLLMKLIFKCD
jgi:hypothetical protein